MAVMSDTDREAGWADFMNTIPAGRTYTVTKQELRAAYNAADAWADANATSYNSALPQPFRGAANAAEKARLLVEVLNRRHNLGL
jgi:hypothetical protein